MYGCPVYKTQDRGPTWVCAMQFDFLGCFLSFTFLMALVLLIWSISTIMSHFSCFKILWEKLDSALNLRLLYARYLLQTSKPSKRRANGSWLVLLSWWMLCNEQAAQKPRHQPRPSGVDITSCVHWVLMNCPDKQFCLFCEKKYFVNSLPSSLSLPPFHPPKKFVPPSLSPSQEVFNEWNILSTGLVHI